MQKNRYIKVFAGGMFLGSVIFVLIYGISILDVTYTDWLYQWKSNPDLMQHQLGFEFFRRSEWKWPLGEYDSYFYPFGTSIVYTDSIPLFSLVFKAIGGWLPQEFQFFGWYGLLCFGLQGGLAALLMQKYSNHIAVSICGSLFCILAPIVMNRLYIHTALASHFLILLPLAFWAYKDCFKSLKARLLFWMGVTGLSVTIQAYFLVMVGIIMVGFLLSDYYEFKSIRRVAIIFGGSVIFTLVISYIIGGFTIRSGMDAAGLGMYTMNLNSFYNPLLVESRFMKKLPTYVFYQYEGSMYMGCGALLLLLCATIIFAFNFKKISKKDKGAKRWIPILLTMVALLILALGPEITFDEKVLFSFRDFQQVKKLSYIVAAIVFLGIIFVLKKRKRYRLGVALLISLLLCGGILYLYGAETIYNVIGKIAYKILSVFRSSGRFAWPIVYILIVASVGILCKVLKTRGAILLVAFCGVIQIIDLQPYLQAKGAITKTSYTYESVLQNDIWDYISKTYKHVELISSNVVDVPDYEPIALLAVKNNMTMGLGYFSRVDVEAAQEKVGIMLREVVEGKCQEDTVYILSEEDQLASYSYVINDNTALFYADGYNILVNKDTIPLEEYKNFAVKEIQGKNKITDIFISDPNVEVKEQSISILPETTVKGAILMPKGNYKAEVFGEEVTELEIKIWNGANGAPLELTKIPEGKHQPVYRFSVLGEFNFDPIQIELRNKGKKSIEISDLIFLREN